MDVQHESYQYSENQTFSFTFLTSLYLNLLMLRCFRYLYLVHLQ